ncbi:phospholipid carrier-dependent glycosyltransferase [Scatolibacter rhodanostii]|uniref:phospholipid carrier-dependent glycosyltransferase n=1 Tax=Scatolibacter rhodanostii TaxID=2014781 RepID=UPI000C06C5E4|nr:phospholipid carrier-dependent glycosyltransferase [Scatolibacter rhodanostii]
MVVSFTLTITFSLIIAFVTKKKNYFSLGLKAEKNTKQVAGLLFFLALILRLWMGYYLSGFSSDIETFKSWGNMTNAVGFDLIYRQDIFLDYPPGYLYILTFLEKVRIIFGLSLSSSAYTLLIKLPAILGDLFCAGVLFYVANKRLSPFMALFMTAAYLFCPPVLLNSANWGQMDSFCLAVFLVSILLLYKEKYVLSGAVFGLSIIIKPQMLTFVPVFIFFAIRRKNYRSLLLAPLAALAVMALVALPFTQDFNFRWLIEQYAETMGGYPYYAVNAYNIWALLGLNWSGLPQSGALSMLLTALGPIIATILCGAVVLKAKDDHVVFAAPILLMVTAYLLTVQMHERYVFPILIFILLLYVFVKDRRILYAFSIVTLAHYANVKHVLYLYQVHGGRYDPNTVFVKVLSLGQIISLGYLLWVIYDMYCHGRVLGDREKITWKQRTADVAQTKEKAFRMLSRLSLESFCLTRRDICFAGIITVLYAGVAFWGLGSHQTALTSWTPLEGESVVIETNHPADTICFIPGLVPDDSHYRAKIGMNVKIETSNDGTTWIDQGVLPSSGVFEWKQQRIDELAKFFRFTALDAEVVINEISMKNSSWEGYEVLTVIEGKGQVLMDEQNLVPLYPTYYDSAYFDEIYHARTAYEYILGLEPYENTHPPLGKLFISLGILIFGMNPFGWRFMGTLFGVLMLPLLYIILKQLSKSSFWSSVGTVLLAVDFMHYTQTRIATIDTYAVFFILAMYSAMIFFLQKDFMRTDIKNLLLPLAMSGVLMGIGIASKWTVAYGAVGLAVLLFAKMGHAYFIAENRKLCFKRIQTVCLWCCLLFVLIPFVIYYLAFLPMTTLPHQSSVWSSFVNYQINMFDYHANLKAEHPFASPWYEWPFMVKPIWFYFTDNLPYADKVSTISSFGNPAVWWVGIPALMVTVVQLVFKKKKAAFVVIVGFLSVYLPWVLVPRIAFIYHYFTAVPFLIMAIVLWLQSILENTSPISEFSLGNSKLVLTKGKLVVFLYIAVAVVLFMTFYPVLSGAETTQAYANSLEWFSQWYFA